MLILLHETGGVGIGEDKYKNEIENLFYLFLEIENLF